MKIHKGDPKLNWEQDLVELTINNRFWSSISFQKIAGKDPYQAPLPNP